MSLFKKVLKYCICLFFLGVCCFSSVNGASLVTEDGAVTRNAKFLNASGDDVPSSLLSKMEEYWGYQVDQAYEAGYGVEAPHVRYQMPIEKYLKIKGKARKLNGVQLLNVERTSNVADVRIKIEFNNHEVKRFGQKYAVLTERWVQVGDVWYHVLKRGMKQVY